MAESYTPAGHSRRSRVMYAAAVVGVALATAGCGGPQINVLGSYFPSWMACLAIGIAVTLVTRLIFTRAGIDPNIGPKGLVYACLALAATLATWLVNFRE